MDATQIEHLFEVNPILVNPLKSTVSDKSIGEPFDSSLEQLKKYTFQGINEGAKYFKVKSSYPDKIGWNYEIILSNPPIAGYQIEGCDKSGCINEIGYNPLLSISEPEKREKTARHEGWHEVQPGKKILSGIYYDVNNRKFKYGTVEEDSKDKYPIGKMILEGGVEVGLEKELNVETSYPVSYSLAKELNQYFNLVEIHKLAGEAEQKLEEKLKDPYFNPNELKFNEIPPELTKLLFILNETPGVQQLAHSYAVKLKTDIPYIV